MIKVIRITDPDCNGCFGASFGDCPDCGKKCTEIVLCKDCEYNRKSVMAREKTLCRKLHAWVEPYDFCAWGDREVTE